MIPVIEIGYNNQNVETPDKYPYWEYPELWDKYNSESYKKVGFVDSFNPYLAASSFYRLSEVTDTNLTKLTIDHTQEIRDGKYGRERACAFFGGYVLRIDGQHSIFLNVVVTFQTFNIGKSYKRKRKWLLFRTRRTESENSTRQNNFGLYS